VGAPGSYHLRAPYDITISPYTKAIVSTEVLAQLPSDCRGIISSSHNWRFGELLDIVPEVIVTRRWTCLRVIIWNHTSRPLQLSRGRNIALLTLVQGYQQGEWPCDTLQH
jgi:dUTPase